VIPIRPGRPFEGDLGPLGGLLAGDIVQIDADVQRGTTVQWDKKSRMAAPADGTPRPADD